MKRLALSLLLLIVLCPSMSFSASGTIEGTVEGYNCVLKNTTCPIGKEDPIVTTESTFVVIQENGKYYFVPNIDRAVMARHITEHVRITGEIDNKYNAIKAQTIEVMKNDKWRLVWDGKFF